MFSLTTWWTVQAARSIVEPERIGQPFLDRPSGGVEIELHAAAQEVSRVEVAQHQVGVGDGRLLPAAAVASRAGLRAG